MKKKKRNSRKKIIIAAAVAVAILLAGALGIWLVWRNHTYTVSVFLAGEENMTLEVGSVFEDPGASASVTGSVFDREAAPLTPESVGSVDANTLGTYTITYSARFEKQHFLGDKQASAQALRTVRVVDSQKPVITLNTVEGSYTLPGQPYEEEGFTAIDNYDGDITGNVTRQERDGKVYYTVSDSSGNETQVVRDIFYDDPVAPVILLTGGEVVQHVVGEVYQDPGFAASDNVDGDITAQVAVSGTVDPETLGRYTLTYTVADAYGNTATATRLVKVVKQELPPLPQGKGGVIYLTFDDGPGPHTQRLLDILDKYDAKATFFVVGRYDLSLVKEMVERGHSVGNHTYTHNYSRLYASEDAFFAELYRTQDKIESVCGIRTRLVRFPGGSSNTVGDVSMRQLTKALVNAGYAYFDWNVDSNDAGGATTADEVLYNVCSAVATKEKAIVLQHDIKDYSVDAVEEIIQWGLANGYTFEALTVSSPGAHHTPKH